MDFNDFHILNNGKKEKLSDIKHGVRKEQLSEKFQNLFDLYDANNDGTLEKNELDIIYNNLSAFSGSDKTLDNLENTQVASIFADKVGIEDADFQGFVKSVSDATADILESKETPTSDGGKEIKTKYKDGTTETISYYQNGDFKHKKIEKKFSETTYEVVINGVRKQVTEAQYHKALEEAKQKQQQKQAKPLDGHYMMSSSFTDFNNVSVNSNTKSREEINEYYSGRYIAESLGVDINTEDGKKIMERMNLLPEDVLIKLQDGKELKEILADQDLEPTFENISNIMEFVFGATLRTDEEQEAYKPQREKLIKQAKITQIITQLYETIANWNEQYTESIGLFGLGAEGIGYLLNKIGVDGCNHYQMTEYYAEYAQKASELKYLNPEKFKEGFEKIYGDDSKFKYNEQAFDKLLSLIESNIAVDKDGNFTEDYKKSIEVALGLSESTLENPNDSTYNQVMNGLGEALIMIATLGWGAETKAGTTLALSTANTFGKAGVALASKQLNNKLLQGTLRFAGQGVKLLGPMINEGTKMALYTMAEGTATNVANRAIKFDREDTLDRFLETEGAVMKGAQGSFGFGAFAGAFGTVVTSKVMQAVSKTSSKTVTALSEKFAKSAVEGNEVFATIMAKSVPTKMAEAAAFATDVLGFTAFESALTIANNYKDITPENLTEILWEEFKGQGYNLGQIKVVSHLIMMLTGSRSARMQSQRYLQDNLPQFKGVKVEQFEGKKIEKIEGVKLERPVEQYLIEMPDGRKIECKNADEMVASMYLIARGETAFSSKFDKPVEEPQDPTVKKLQTVKNNALKAFKNLKTMPSAESGYVAHPVSLKQTIKAMKSAKIKQLAYQNTAGKVVEGQERLSKPEKKSLLKQIKNNSFGDKNAYINELFEKMLNMTERNSDYYRFTTDDIVEIINKVTPENKEVFEMLLNAQDYHNEDLLINAYTLAPLLDVYSTCEIETAKNVLNLLSRTRSQASNVDDVSRIIKLSKEFPNEMEILTSNYASNYVDRVLEEDVEDLMLRYKNGSSEEKEIIEVIGKIADESFVRYGNDVIIKVLDKNPNLSAKEILTLCYSHKDSPREALFKVFEMIDKNGKENLLDVNMEEYTPSKKVTDAELKEFCTKNGLSEEEANELFSNPIAKPILQLFIIDTQIFNGELCGLQIPTQQIVKGVAENIRAGLIKELPPEFSKISGCLRYLTKENFEIYKQKTGVESVKDFAEYVSQFSFTSDNSKTFALISQITGRKFTIKDSLSLDPVGTIRLSEMTEQEIRAAIQKLKDLNLYNDETNVLLMVSKAKELETINPSAEIKELAQYLSSNKFIAEGCVIDILKAVQSDNPTILADKIRFVKELVNSNIFNNMGIGMKIGKLSSTNTEIYNKQKAIFEEFIENKDGSWQYGTILNFLQTDNITEFNSRYELYNKLKQTGKSGVIYVIDYFTNSPKNLDIMIPLVNKLCDKNVESYEISIILSDIGRFCSSNAKEYVDLYIKGLNEDLGNLKNIYKDILLMKFADIKDFKLDERLEMYEKLSGIDDLGKAQLEKLGINCEELNDKIINSLSFKSPLVEISNKQQQKFVKQIIANNNPQAENVLKTFDFAQFGKDGIPLKYSRERFNQKINELLKDLPENEVAIVLKHFGLEQGNAGFDGLPNNREFNNTEVSKECIKAAKQIKEEIESFTLRNEVLIDDPVVKEVLDGLVQGLPEFTSIVGKQQHGTHVYSVDIHTLKVLQSAMNHPLYKNLNDQDKTILKIAVILHDLGKKGGVVDNGHASLSADYTWSILDKYPFPPIMKDRIIDIVDNHHWFEKYNTGRATAQNVAVRCRRPEDLKIYEIFSKSDFENVNPTFHIERSGLTSQAEFDAFMQEKMKPIEEAVNNIYQNANFIFDSQFIQNGNFFPTQSVEIDGKSENLKVLNFSDLESDANLQQYGFAPGTTKANARFTVHITAPKFSKMETVFRLTESPVFQSTWSASLVKADNNRTYYNKKFGFVFKTPQSNISEAIFFNSASGRQKDLQVFEQLLFGTRKIEYEDGKMYDARHYVKQEFMKVLSEKGYDLTDAEYSSLTQLLFKKTFTTQISKDINIGGKTIKAEDLIEALEYSRDQLFNGGNEHNEIVSINPKVKGLFAKVEKIEDCPPEFLKFAKDHDLPIILMKPKNAENNNDEK